jgi:hypothetical protein
VTFPILPVAQSVHETYYQPPTNSPFPLDYVIAPDGTVAYFSTEYDPESMVQVIDALLGKDSALQVSPGELDFGPVQMGEQSTLLLEFSNLGEGELELSSIESDLADFSTNLDELILPPGSTAGLLVTYAPLILGPVEGGLLLQSNDPLQEELTIPLFGQGVSATSADAPDLRFTLGPPRPNPFSAGTSLRFSLPGSGQLRLDIYDLQGRHVRSLIEAGEVFQAGEHVRSWDGRDENSHSLTSGLYFMRLKWEGKSATRKMLLLR